LETGQGGDRKLSTSEIERSGPLLRAAHNVAAGARPSARRKAKLKKERLQTAGYGDGRPVADNSTEAGRAQNRRVELVKQ